MEFDENRFKPDSNRSVLYRQVQEQSDVCDVTIQVGEWMNKFHWCVLVLSPFIESLRKHRFMERRTGIIKLNVASPQSTEAAILYLYGKKPKLTEDNISAILDLSEFLMIPNLKSSCVRHIKTMEITTDNCIKLLELSCVYEFDLQKCYEFIRSHLDNVLLKEEATHLTKESVIELFSDPYLSYVSSEDRISFLVNWSKHCQKNEAAFKEVFDCIDLDEMGIEYFEEVLQHPFVPRGCLTTPATSDEHRVLLFTNSVQNQTLTCFDIDKKKWYRIEFPSSFDDQRMYYTDTINGVGNLPLPEIYMVANRRYYCSVRKLNLHSKQISVKEVSADKQKEFSCFFTDGNMFTGVTNKTAYVERIVKVIETVPLRKNYRGILTARDSIPRRVNSYVRKESVRFSTLFYGRLVNTHTEIDPVVTIRGTEICSYCVNSELIACLLSMRENILYIYDIANCHLDIVKFEFIDSIGIFIRRHIKLVPSDNGFILHDNNQVVLVSRLYGPDLAEKYVVHNVALEYDKTWRFVRYFYCDTDKSWFRFLRTTYQDKMGFASVSHEDLIEKNCSDLAWTPLPLPIELEKLSRGKQTYIIRMHKSLLRCLPSCPHCDALKAERIPRSTRTTRAPGYYDTDHEDDYLYEDPDENCYDNVSDVNDLY